MKTNNIRFYVEKENRLADVLKEQFSKRFYRYMKSSQAMIQVNGQERRLYERVEVGDCIEISYPSKTKSMEWPEAEQAPEIVFENEHYLVVNKRGGILTIPTQGNPMSLYQELVYYLGNTDIHILNRLDKETSGLVVVAKDRYAASLLEPTHKHMIRKYLCLVEGQVSGDGEIRNYIAKEETSNRRYVSENGQLAISHFKVLRQFESEALLKFILDTGRTHQIRVHTSSMGHPIIGDKLYGGKENSILCLTSYYVEFEDPFTKETICCKIDKGW